MSRTVGFFAELRRRNVLRAGALYAAGSWALAQGIAQLGPSFGAPDWVARWFVIACVIGFPFWLAFAWFYEFTPEGLKRESEIDPSDSITHSSGKKLDFAIIGVLALAVVLLLTDRFVLRHGVNQAVPAAATATIPDIEKDPSIAVLPLVDMSQGKDQGYFSDGISEELLNLLAKVPKLRVIARTSSFSFKGKDVDIAKALATQDSNLATIHLEPLFANLHKDPRWLPLLHKLGQAPEQLAKIEFKVTLPTDSATP